MSLKKNARKAPPKEQRERESIRLEMHRLLSVIEQRGEQEHNLDAVSKTAENLGDKELLERIANIKRRMRK